MTSEKSNLPSSAVMAQCSSAVVAKELSTSTRGPRFKSSWVTFPAISMFPLSSGLNQVPGDRTDRGALALLVLGEIELDWNIGLEADVALPQSVASTLGVAKKLKKKTHTASGAHQTVY